MWTKSRSLLLSRIMVWAFIVLMLAMAIFLPNELENYRQRINQEEGRLPASPQQDEQVQSYSLFLACCWASVLPALAALVCLHLLLNNISKGSVFIAANVRYIRIVSWCCFLVAAIYLLLVGLVFPAIMLYSSSLILALMMIFIGLIVRVVKNVIAQAVEIKTENDLTV